LSFFAVLAKKDKVSGGGSGGAALASPPGAAASARGALIDLPATYLLLAAMPTGLNSMVVAQWLL
jgi:hypothetical protein